MAFSPRADAPVQTPAALSESTTAFAASSAFAGLPSLTTTLAVVIGFLVLEQARWRYKKRHLPGDTFTIPIMGRFLNSLTPTVENYKKGWNFPLSAVSVFHYFIVMAANTELSRKILHSPAHAEPCLVAAGKKIVMPDNWVFLSGKAHVDYRKSLNVLFTRRALGEYLGIQDSIFRRHFKKWLSNPNAKAEPYQMQFRDLNMETSLRIFCGTYIPAHGEKALSDKYWLITLALELVNFPFAFPGTKVWNAVQARKVAMKWFMHASAESKKRMATGAEPVCMIDKWVKQMIDAKNWKGDQDGERPPIMAREYSDKEIAQVVFSFLFASQDAMSSGLTYAFQLLADHPDVLQKMREEVYAVRGDDVTTPLDYDTLESMTYTAAVVKEVLRFRPPVIMVPYMCLKPFNITPDYVVPKGTMVIPSFWNSLHNPDIYDDPDSFKPERWLDPLGKANSNPQDYLVFGAGPHKCIAHDYAKMHIGAVVSMASQVLNWEHELTPLSDQIKITATIFPLDGCRMKFSKRTSTLEY